MTDPVHDPVHRVRYTFTPEGEADLLVDCWMAPGGGLPEHLHPRQTETWWLVDGQVEFGLDGDKRVIGPADGEMVVHPGMKHSLAAVSGSEAHLRCRVSPANDLQAFLEESAAAAREGLFMKGGIPRNLRGARWAATFLERHREDTVMSFPPPFMASAMIALFGRGGRKTSVMA